MLRLLEQVRYDKPTSCSIDTLAVSVLVGVEEKEVAVVVAVAVSVTMSK